MGKILTAREGPVFGMHSSAAMFEKLKFESSRLQGVWHPYDSFNFLVTAWHLFQDWTTSDDPKASCRMKRHRRRLPTSMNFVLDVVRDIVNGSKHFQLNSDSAAKRRVTEVHTGDEVGFYEYYFHEDLPAVTVEDHWYFSIRVLHNLLMCYYDWVFNESVSVEEFPTELLDALLYCNIAERRGGPSPAIWLLGIESAYHRVEKMDTTGPSSEGIG